MEITTTNSADQQQNESLIIDEQIKKSLLELSKWAKFLAIIGFVGIGLMLLAAVFMIAVGSYMSSLSAVSMPNFGLLGVFYIVFGGLYFVPVYYLFKSSVGIKKGILSNDQNSVAGGFEYLKSHYKFIGISTIVILSLYILIIVIAIIASVYLASQSI